MRLGTNLSNTPARRVFWFLVVATTLSLCNNIATAADKEFTLADVRAAWAKRQKRVRTLEIQLDRKCNDTWRDPPGAVGPKPDGQPKNGEQYQIEQRIAIRVDGEKFAMRMHTKDASKISHFDLERYAFNGKTSYKFMTSSRLQEGRISSQKHAYGTKYVHFHPIAVCFRPLVPTISGFAFKDLRLEPRKSGETRVDGHLCQMLIRKDADGLEYIYFVDPKAEFIIRRIEERARGRRNLQWDISFSRDKKYGWVPSKWTMESGALKAAVKVTKYETNKTIPEHEFKIAFPRGVAVIDERKRKTGK